jgi:hypothetical protein
MASSAMRTSFSLLARETPRTCAVSAGEAKSVVMTALAIASSDNNRLSSIPSILMSNLADYTLPAGGYAALRLPFAMFTIGSGMRTRLNRPDFFSVASTKTKLSPMTIGSLSNSSTSPYSFI